MSGSARPVFHVIEEHHDAAEAVAKQRGCLGASRAQVFRNIGMMGGLPMIAVYGFAEFRAFPNVRTPRELPQHMTGVIAYGRTMLRGGKFAPSKLDTFDAEIDRFHSTLAALRDDLADPALTAAISDEQFLQGPLADAMTHAGQPAMLRRVAGSPVPSEDFIFAEVRSDNVGRSQAAPRTPDL